jgi:hypothetical protein
VLKKGHQQDSKLELAYFWYVEVASIKGNAKMSKLRIGIG